MFFVNLEPHQAAGFFVMAEPQRDAQDYTSSQLNKEKEREIDNHPLSKSFLNSGHGSKFKVQLAYKNGTSNVDNF